VLFHGQHLLRRLLLSQRDHVLQSGDWTMLSDGQRRISRDGRGPTGSGMLRGQQPVL